MHRRPNKYTNWKRGPGRKPTEDDPFIALKVYIPRVVYNKLKIISENTQNTMNRTVVSGLFNAINEGMSFEVDTSTPGDAPASYGLYDVESMLLYQFISKSYNGMSLDLLVMCRDDIGIPDRNILMYALYQLIRNKSVELLEDIHSKHPKIKCVSFTRRIKKFRRVEGVKNE